MILFGIRAMELYIMLPREALYQQFIPCEWLIADADCDITCIYPLYKTLNCHLIETCPLCKCSYWNVFSLHWEVWCFNQCCDAFYFLNSDYIPLGPQMLPKVNKICQITNAI